MEKHSISRFGIIECFGSIFLIQFVIELALKLIERIFEFQVSLGVYQSIATILFLVIFSIYLSKRLGRNAFRYVGLIRINEIRLRWVLVLVFVTVCVQYVLLGDRQGQLLSGYEFSQFHSGLLWSITYQVILAPIAEEIIYRGAIIRSLLSRVDELLAICISSFCWAMIHIVEFGIIGVLFLFFYGALLSKLRLITGSIYSGIIVHASVNSIWMLFVYFNFFE